MCTKLTVSVNFIISDLLQAIVISTKDKAVNNLHLEAATGVRCFSHCWEISVFRQQHWSEGDARTFISLDDVQ